MALRTSEAGKAQWFAAAAIDSIHRRLDQLNSSARDCCVERLLIFEAFRDLDALARRLKAARVADGDASD
jgi:hypothetical protein